MCLVDNGNKISVEEGINKGYSFGPLSNVRETTHSVFPFMIFFSDLGNIN